MAKNFNEGIDALVNLGLDGMPVAGKLWIVLFTELESEVGPTDTLATLTQAVATELSATSLTSASRIINLGGPHAFPETSGIVGSIGVLTDDPDTGGCKVICLEDVNAGSTLDLAVVGPYTASSLSVKVAYQDEP